MTLPFRINSERGIHAFAYSLNYCQKVECVVKLSWFFLKNKKNKKRSCLDGDIFVKFHVSLIGSSTSLHVSAARTLVYLVVADALFRIIFR